MKFILARLTAPAGKNRRSTLLAMHRSGIVQVFRRHSLFRVWEPLRENFGEVRDFVG